MKKNQLRNVCVFAIMIIIFPGKAHAYIDPNTGGFFFTSILPFVYGLLAAVVVFWKRIVLFVKKMFSRKEGEGDG